MLIERRKYSRYNFTEEYAVLISIDNSTWQHVEPCNVSIGGIKIRSDQVIDVNEYISIKIVNTSKDSVKSIEIDGYIVRISPEFDRFYYGIAFEPLIDNEIEELREILSSIV